MSPKRGERVAPPPAEHWDIRFANNDSVKGWEELCNHAGGNTRAAWFEMSTNPAPRPHTPRHHPLRDQLANATIGGRQLDQWQIEVTSGGRIWYALDVKHRTVWITYASPRHPKITE